MIRPSFACWRHPIPSPRRLRSGCHSPERRTGRQCSAVLASAGHCHAPARGHLDSGTANRDPAHHTSVRPSTPPASTPTDTPPPRHPPPQRRHAIRAHPAASPARRGFRAPAAATQNAAARAHLTARPVAIDRAATGHRRLNATSEAVPPRDQ